ncbi:hypothetical protein C6T52_19700 [Burkholderia multivorans]|nr:hypothetical protein C6T52_19700 [Burkholderia multivorans]
MRLAAYAQTNDLLVKRHELALRAALARGSARPELAWIGLAAAACIQGKHDECMRCVRAAVDLAARDAIIIATGIALLSDIGELDQAEKLSEQLQAIVEPDDRDWIWLLANLHLRALNFEDAIKMMQRFGADADEQSILLTKQLLEVANRHHVSLEKRRELVKVALHTVRAQGCAIKQTALEDFGDTGARFEFYVDVSPSRCGEINQVIAEVLCERFDDPVPEVVTFACRPVESYEFHGKFVPVQR